MAVRFTLTPRLMTFGIVSLFGLLVLLFLLGLQLGRMWGTEEGHRQAMAAVAAAQAEGEDGDPDAEDGAEDPTKPRKWRKPKVPALVRKVVKPLLPKP